jgi:mono/diheme cytochrome c family protein
MSRRLFVAIFKDEEDVLGAARELRERGYVIADVYTPYAVHGMDEAMGLRRTRLPWVCFAFGLLGAALKVWFEIWTTSIDWPINVGGKPWNSLPAFVPITFEVMVLLAGLSTVFAFLWSSRLYPGKAIRLVDPAVTNSNFVIVLVETDAAFDFHAVKILCEGHRALQVEERVEEPKKRKAANATTRNALNAVLFLVLVAVLAVNWMVRWNPAQRNREFLADMVNSPAYESQAENTAVIGGNTALLPVPNTLALGFMPLHYGETPEEAVRAGEELTNPVQAGDTKALDRGAVVYSTFCAVCHGPAGVGDGTITTRGFPPPPSLFAENAMKMKDGRIFHIITYGQKNMPAYSAQVWAEDRWKAVSYIRSLQVKHVQQEQQQKQQPQTPAPTPTEPASPPALLNH